MNQESRVPEPDGAPGSADAPAYDAAASNVDSADSRPIRNLRITFWGVQGSCPIFPSAEEIRDYTRRVAKLTLAHARETAAHSSAARAANPVDAPPSTIELPDLPVYGGDTSCIEVETAGGDVLVFDLGTGVRPFSSRLLHRWRNRRDRVLHVFGSHQHLDHRMGLSFAGFCFAAPDPFTVQVYGPHLFLKALDKRYGLFSRRVKPGMHLDDPLDYRLMSATFIGTELTMDSEGHIAADSLPWSLRSAADPVKVGATTIRAFPAYHGSTPCLAYKVCHGSASFVYCTDHELRHGPAPLPSAPADPRELASEAAEQELIRQCQGVDVGYFDGQYLLPEYRGERGIGSSPPVSRLDWGHGCIEDVVARATRCCIGRTFIGHHDPERQWPERVKIDQELIQSSKASGVSVELAKAGAVIEV